jgi:hypothetical protein
MEDTFTGAVKHFISFSLWLEVSIQYKLCYCTVFHLFSHYFRIITDHREG